MALLRAIGLKRPYEPKPRFMHHAGVADGESIIYAGWTRDFDKTKEELSSTAEVFDHYLEQWRQLKTTGSPPKGLYHGGCCISPSGDLYVYGGHDGTSGRGGLYKLSSLNWTQLSGESDVTGPSKKSGCGMVCFSKKKVAVIGGYGPPPASLQPGATFIKERRVHFTSGQGWTNEVHILSLDTNERK